MAEAAPATGSASLWWAAAVACAGSLVVLWWLRSSSQPLDASVVVPPGGLHEVARAYEPVTFNALASFSYPDDTPTARDAAVIPDQIKRLEGRKVSVMGFMLPLDFDGRGVGEFILNASYDMCYYGAPTTPNQFVAVRMTERRRVPFVHTPLIVFGTFKIRPERRAGRLVGLYYIDADRIGLGAR